MRDTETANSYPFSLSSKRAKSTPFNFSFCWRWPLKSQSDTRLTNRDHKINSFLAQYFSGRLIIAGPSNSHNELSQSLQKPTPLAKFIACPKLKTKSPINVSFVSNICDWNWLFPPWYSLGLEAIHVASGEEALSVVLIKNTMLFKFIQKWLLSNTHWLKTSCFLL